ncbi:hypothetical protein [Streptomyces sp. ISBFB 2968]|uniref:hypothetical protein n=1 Tax=Streptomyces sp. ISBFB 2968 TaxID=2903527 RepID=UPI002FDC34B3
MASTEPIRKSSLPTTPPSEYEFHTVHGGQPDSPGVLLVPDDDSGPVVVRRRVTYGDWEPVRPDRWADEPVDGNVTPLREQLAVALDNAYSDHYQVGYGLPLEEMTEAGLSVLHRATSEVSAQADSLQERLRLAHQARRAKEHQLDDIRRALCDAGFMNDDDPYGHADLADVIRQVGEALREKPTGVREQRERPAHPDGTPYRYHEIVAEGWEFCEGCHTWSTATIERPHTCTGPNSVQFRNPEDGA